MSRKAAVVPAVAVIVGALIGLGIGWLRWGRETSALAARLAAVESSAAQVQEERERLRRELSDIVRERREMADTAEHLRAKVEMQLRRLESLALELGASPEAEGGAPADAPP
jgi:hypothetical protein